MKIFWLILGIVLFIVWVVRLFYYLGDERRRFRIVETKNKEYRIEMMGLFIQIWQRALHSYWDNNDPELSLDSDSITKNRYAQYDTLEKAKAAVDAHFKKKATIRKDTEVVNTWYMNEDA